MTQRLEKSRKRKSDDVEKDEIDEETNEIPIRIRKCQTNKKPKAEQERAIQVGDRVDLSELLFTKERDFLVKYNQNQQVKAEELAGKVVVLHFVSLVHGSFFWSKLVTHLSDIYSKLHSLGSFEIVFVAVRDDICCKGMPVGSTPRKRFLERFSTMAWPAIPFSDLKSRKHLERIFGISNPVDLMPRSSIIDPRGVVLQCGGNSLFFRYGAAGYPFTHERIDLLDYKDYAAKFEPSVTNLLASSERDYVITNKGDQVPLRNLENKVVGLYFCPDLNNKRTTMKLKMAYEELSRYTEGFEVVLINTHGWWNTYGRKDEDSFRKAFGKMPWLALPYEDTDCNRKLQRIFEYPQELVGTKPDSTLVIIGPNGKFFEPLGANILLEYGVSAYPFTLFDAADLELEMVSKVKPEMFWDLDAVFTRRNGSQVRFSQLVGKRIIVLFQSRMSKLDCTLRELESRYLKMKGTDDEFEVIHIYDGCDAAAMPWLMHPPFVRDSHAQKLVDRVFHGKYYGLLAFDYDGTVVRSTSYPTVGDNMVFPFIHDGDMKHEVVLELQDKLACK